MPSQFQVAQFIGAAADTAFNSEDHGGSPRQAAATLETRYGWQVVGLGAFGVVFFHPDNYDLVVKVGVNKLDGWLDYAAFCMRNPGGKGIEVHEIVLFEHCYVAIMERLEHIHTGGANMLASLEAERQQANYGDGWARDMRVALGRPYDLHNNNIMARSNGEWVWTDPYCHGNQSYKEFLEGSRVVRNRTSLGSCSPSPAVRAEAENCVLRDEPVDDNRAHGQGVQSPLLPGRGSRRLHSAQHHAFPATVGREERAKREAFERGRDFGRVAVAERRAEANRIYKELVDMAGPGVHRPDHCGAIRFPVQPRPRSDNTAFAERVAGAEPHREAEVPAAKLKPRVPVFDFKAVPFDILEAAFVNHNRGRAVMYKGRQAVVYGGNPRYECQRLRNELVIDGTDKRQRVYPDYRNMA